MSDFRSDTHYDESRVPEYELPPLGPREAMIRDFERYVYGTMFPAPVSVSLQGRDMWERDGMRFIQLGVAVETDAGSLQFDTLVVRPEGDTRVPAVVGLNFRGNYTTVSDTRVRLPAGWVPDDLGATEHAAVASSRGAHSSRWPVEQITAAGYALVTTYCGDFDPDYHDGFANGVHALFPAERDARSPGTIAAWAWGLSRVLDLIGLEEADVRIDAARVAVLGHSRLGKTALWAAANDTRFAAAISNESGCGGAALTRRGYGETVRAITRQFPHWFCETFSEYAARDAEVPVDQHMLIASIAPRPVAVGSAEGDKWADPRGEFVSLQAAAPAWAEHGLQAALPDEWPAVGSAAGECVQYHLRSGNHDLTSHDWARYLSFLDRRFATAQ